MEGIEGDLFSGAISSQIYVHMFRRRRPCQRDCSPYSEAGGVLRGENPWHECRRAILLMREVDGPFYSKAEGF